MRSYLEGTYFLLLLISGLTFSAELIALRPNHNGDSAEGRSALVMDEACRKLETDFEIMQLLR
jgi:hypothetical protein